MVVGGLLIVGAIGFSGYILDRRNNETVNEAVTAISNQHAKETLQLKEQHTLEIKGLTDHVTVILRNEAMNNEKRFKQFETNNQNRLNDVKEMVTEVMERFEVTLRAKRQSFSSSSNTGEVTVLADRRRMGQVLSNLLSNASKFSGDGKRIYVECIAERGSASITIRDEGIGIPKDDIEKVFDPFFRGSGPSVSAISGTGTGLFIAKKLIEYQGGDITLSSKPGVGTAVTVTLPCVQRKLAPPAGPNSGLRNSA